MSAIRTTPDAPARRVTTTALLAALLAVSAIISVPLGTIPATLQTMVVVLIALVVPPRWGAFAVGTYLLAGVAGMPVFSGMRGGLPVLIGPTGGYLVGFLAAVPAGAWVRARLERGGRPVTRADIVAGVVAIVIVYVFGWLQLVLVAGLDPLRALLVGVAPFVVPDGLKTAAAIVLAPAVRKAIAL